MKPHIDRHHSLQQQRHPATSAWEVALEQQACFDAQAWFPLQVTPGSQRDTAGPSGQPAGGNTHLHRGKGASPGAGQSGEGHTPHQGLLWEPPEGCVTEACVQPHPATGTGNSVKSSWEHHNTSGFKLESGLGCVVTSTGSVRKRWHLSGVEWGRRQQPGSHEPVCISSATLTRCLRSSAHSCYGISNIIQIFSSIKAPPFQYINPFTLH